VSGLLDRGSARAERLVPRSRVAAWQLGFLAMVLAFFAVLAIALGLAAARIAADWGAAVARPATLQIVAPEAEVEAQARAALGILRETPGVRSVRVIEPEEQRALLEPWFGPDLPVESLPLPLLIEVGVSPEGIDAAALRARLAEAAPGASYDDHAAWRAPLVATAWRVAAFAASAVAALALALTAGVALAARGAVAASGTVIRTLRLVGARDAFIAGAFTRRFVLDATLGAVLGTLAAMLLLMQVPPGREDGYFLAGIGLVGWHWLVPVIVPALWAVLAWTGARAAARRGLRRWS
jgi:cell division transport system permease protein